MKPKCRSCKGTDLELVLDLGPQPSCNLLISSPDDPETDYPLMLLFCNSCTLVQIPTAPPKEEIFGQSYPYVSGTTSTLCDHFKETADRLVRDLGLGDNDFTVDIGSNDGTLLSKFPGRRLGVEPSGVASTVPTLRRFFGESVAKWIMNKHGRPKLVTATGVLFHLDDYHDFFLGLRALDCVVVAQCMYLGAILDNTAFDAIYHEHTVYWTLHSLRLMALAHDLEVVDVRALAIHGGSFEVHFAPVGTRKVKGTVADWLEMEIAKGYTKMPAYRAFETRSIVNASRISETVHKINDQGKLVYAYGAPAKGSTLLNYCRLTQDDIPIAVEKNPLKFGKYMPKSHVAIVDEAHAYRPSVFLLLAHNFLQEIALKERVYLATGGQMIVPVPEIRFIP